MEVKVQPRSSRNQICGEVNGCLKIKLTAPPVDGEANQALLKYLADILHISKSSISIVKGDTGRQKIIDISGLDPDSLSERLRL